MAHFIYGVATNTGKGFFTADDRRKFFLRGYPADVWMKKVVLRKQKLKHKL